MAKIRADHDLYRRQSGETDRQIDALVVELYGLTEGEIRVVEGRITETRRGGERGKG